MKLKADIIPLHRVAGIPAEMSDEALVAACTVGDAAALGALYDRHVEPMRRFLGRLCGSRNPDLDDLVQTTFETVVRAAARFDHRSSVRTWLLGIANNTARHYLRGERRRTRLGEAVGAAPQYEVNATADLVERERVRRLEAAILELPAKLREAFVLVYLEGLSGGAVARLVDVREGVIWKRLHQARTELRQAVEGALQ